MFSQFMKCIFHLKSAPSQTAQTRILLILNYPFFNENVSSHEHRPWKFSDNYFFMSDLQKQIQRQMYKCTNVLKYDS